MSNDNPLLAAALAWAAAGVPVFPCSPSAAKGEGKRPLVPRESAPGAKDGGLYLATTDAETIRGWWRRWPKALIGMPTGARSGVVVIDLDPRTHPVEVMLHALFEWAVSAGEMTVAEGAETRVFPVRSVTQSGGLHLWFAAPDGVAVGNRVGLFAKVAGVAEAIREHVDVRGDGGYVIVPPSIMDDGKAYVFPDGYGDLRALPPLDGPLGRGLLDLLLKRGAFAAAAARATSAATATKAGAASTSSPEDEAVRRYGLAALDSAARDIASAQPGMRNQTINDRALSIGHLVGAGAIAHSTALAVLVDACLALGLTSDDKALRPGGTVERALRDGAAKPSDLGEIRRKARERADRAARREMAPAMPTEGEWVPPGGLDDYGSASGGGHTPAPSAGPVASSSQSGAVLDASPKGWGESAALDLELGFKPLTDLGNAERFAARYKGRLIYVAAHGWLVWTGQRWAREGADEMVTRAVHDVVRRIQDEAKAVAASDRDHLVGTPPKVKLYSEKVADWGRSSEAAAKLKPIPPQAAPYLAVAPSALDADPLRINVANGTLVIRRGPGEGDPITLRPHDPGDYITKLAPVIYDPNAAAPVYDRFLAEVQPAPAMRRFLHQWGGYSLTGDVGEQKLCFFYGKGKNGKSTLVDAWGAVAGDYGETVPIETFLDQGRGRNAGAATPDLAILPGVRFLRTSEPEKGAKLAEALIKLVTGGEPIQARHLNRDYFKFRPAFKLTMSGNYRPSIDGTDEGIWRRLVLVPWLVTVGSPDRLLPLKLAAEGSGILNRLLDGLRDYLDGGMVWPDAVVEATEQYREDSDPLGRFLADAVRPSPGGRVQVSDLHRVHSAWARVNGEKEWSAKGLSAAMKERGFRSKQSNVMWWLDVVLVKSERDYEDLPDHPP
ncbi:phage/plasmid primase, P4 family [Oharaeibacter diazotrophicus]|uniref:Putative DNA primase/helicase n=1 Tax=Oharaeibacter diazotrophicus TaxID=1920512 RepID=A0A4R6RG89_9HYPH|nr:phage/plasmid primase, P4 family [Oharaeibacter diazotrophicus]TDP85379.1 putative DNA primase/helicase [Oharaeibacter diazotrophicus]BBE74349.1 hypothetical protein OHA_1_03980 [Pleomorphomonas sp. SM30]GLS75958.1 hypothetical protein GCM10007904_12930 [Oharaeibacter diazotrophicus]